MASTNTLVAATYVYVECCHRDIPDNYPHHLLSGVPCVSVVAKARSKDRTCPIYARTSEPTCGSAQHVLTQEPMVSASLGQRITLSCHLNTGPILQTNFPYWYQHKPGQTPRVLVFDTNIRPSAIPDRFSGYRSGNFFYLTISEVRAEDDANYYCLVWFSGLAHCD
ncbi:hypothetical protein GDO78_013641 [Eleutherodactylus coqui]|uniref:Ig-like domain-containing protein n=1 Tax=Eleutherodactylus coqui TaxID=57060 RepID=A0A8J6C4A2_ELECQ|nr:hypothetical protein GDO78_013641 [Eleutherodactylus coqui]